MKNLQIILTAFVLTLTVNAQKIYLPVIPFEIEFEYAPQYLSQWLKHPNYSMIEAVFNPKDTANLQIILTETETSKRIFYVNTKTRAEYLKMSGKDAYLTNIDFKQTQEIEGQPSFGFAFADKTGQPILWRVNLATVPSERGAGLTELPAVRGLRLNYRDSGTAVGEGTAVQIGEQIIEADLWKEISVPPYFVAYRGAVTVGLHSGTFLLGEEKWTFTKHPTKLEKGERWILKNGEGLQKTLEISSLKAEEIVLDETNPQFDGAALVRLVLNISPQGWKLKNYNLTSHSQNMSIEFASAIPLFAEESDNFESEFVINQGNRKKLVVGKVVGVREKDSYSKMIWRFRAPDWVKKKTLESMIKFAENGYSIGTKEVIE